MQSGLYNIIFAILLVTDVYGLHLKRVLILSRHSQRSPMTYALARLTPKKWPEWNVEPGNLTPKGALLESFMGDYFMAWLKREGLIPDPCPEEKSVHIYANSKNRTRESAKAFTDAAFKNCNVTVNFKNITGMDPIFNPIVRNTTESFKQLAKQEMLDKIAKSNLTDVYLALNDITDIKNSATCREDGYCDLSKVNTGVTLEVGLEPNTTGAFFISNKIICTFLLGYYEGLPLEDIGWGKIRSEDQWKVLSKSIHLNMNVRFGLTTASKDLIKPLINYMKEDLDRDRKFTMLVGHDSNINPLLISMQFRPFVLPGQYELIPIGSKLVFQQWTDGEKDFLKVEYVYQSVQQIRNAEKLSLENPPKNITMYLKYCETNDDGFCLWSDFEKILNDLLLYFCSTFFPFFCFL